MAVAIATLFLAGLALYAATGLLFAAAFVTVGIGRVDHAAHGAPWGFRLLIIPGAAALWPWMLARWVGALRKGHRS